MDEESRRRFQDIASGRIQAAGSFNLAVAPATSTTVLHPSCSKSSIVATQAMNASASNSDIVRIIPGNGLFVVTHTSNAASRQFGFAIFTPV